MSLLADLLARPDWQDDALCAEPAYRDLPWFAELGESPDKAKNVCRRCLCREECLAYALAHHVDHGIWGALSPKERKALRRAPAA